jgi:DNA polymerase-3 subunit delta'
VISRGLSPDLLLVKPGGKSYQIRLHLFADVERSDDQKSDPPAAATFLRVGPVSSSAKVVLIEEAERMNLEASNALLKMLEEPPPYARFVLSTSNRGKLLPTILSRCLLIAADYEPPSGVPESIAALSGGAPGIADRLKAEGLAEWSEDLFRFASSIPNRTRGEALRMSEELDALADRYRSFIPEDDRAAERATRVEVVALFANALSYFAAQGETWPIRLLERCQTVHASVQGNVRWELAADWVFV